jgi:membrane-associated PAP2 superfamily phosphatase
LLLLGISKQIGTGAYFLSHQQLPFENQKALPIFALLFGEVAQLVRAQDS